MDESYSGSDVSLSPSQILERLHVLRQLQLMQQGKLQKQRLQYQESPQNSTHSTITEIVSQFSQSTSFNTFRSLLENPGDTSNDATPRHTSNKSPQVQPNDLIDGVSVLNLSQESELILQSPLSLRSKASVSSKQTSRNTSGNSTERQSLPIKKQISLDDMPILSPKKDFEALIIEKMKNEMNAPKSKILQKEKDVPNKGKKPFLRRGEGMARFGLKKNDIVIQNTHSLPWKQNSNKLPLKKNPPEINKKKNVEVQIVVDQPKLSINANENLQKTGNMSEPANKVVSNSTTQEGNNKQSTVPSVVSSTCDIHVSKPTFPHIQKEVKIQPPKGKHPLLGNKGKTWAAVLTKEQDDFLRQLKQSDYYKNFTSPAKSVLSDISCDENLMRLKQNREMAEQNMFELLEDKVNHESFDIDSSFIGRFINRNMNGLKSSDLECSGESTPLIMQKCLANNPKLMSIFPNMHRTRNENSQSEADTCNSEYTECCNETCTSASSCCSCNTVEETNNSDRVNRKYIQRNTSQHDKSSKEAEKQPQNEPCQNNNDNDILKAEMAEMNAKLIATSDLLKDRLKELEDEIETFRKENSNLTKMREEIDCEKHKFYEEKAAFEQKFNEEKILSEYYLAEEKDKLNKQKQIYERQVREMRGRLNKKEKDEVINLKKEISDLKEEIRLKDAKSTTVIARLRNQLKIIEKEKKELQDEVEKLKKENRRIQHSNDITRRMSNIKYLEEINKKMTNMKTNNTQSQVELDPDIKYKAFEIERQSRSRRVQPAVKNPLRARAKSVPNLNVTSRYAKYFSQRDVVSPTERNQTLNIEAYPYEEPDRDLSDNEVESLKDVESISSRDISDNEGENSLEKIYMERFQEHSKHSDQSKEANRSKSSQSNCQYIYEKNTSENTDAFFFHRSNSTSSSTRNSKSPNQTYQPSGCNTNRSKSPVSILSHRSSSGRQSPLNVTRESQKPDYLSSYSRSNSLSKSKSPVSILSNHTYGSQRQPTVINRDQYDNRLSVSPEPAVSKSSLTKTVLKPTELRKPDGSRELKFPNGNVKYLSADGKYSKFVYYNGDVKENFYNEGRIKYYYAETKTYHTTHPDGLEVLEFSDGQVEKRYKDGSSEIRLPNGSVRYFDPKNEHVREEWRFPDGATLTVAASGDRRVVFANGQVEVHTRDHKRREFPDGTVKLLYNDGTSETRYASGRVRIKDKHGNLIMDSVPG